MTASAVLQHSSHAASTTPCSLIQLRPSIHPSARPSACVHLCPSCSHCPALPRSDLLRFSSAQSLSPPRVRAGNCHNGMPTAVPPFNSLSPPPTCAAGRTDGTGRHLLCALVRSPHRHGCGVGIKPCRTGLTFAPRQTSLPAF